MAEIKGETIKGWREQRGLSQQALADLVPMKVGTLRDWELPNGKGKPPEMFWRVLESIDIQLRGGMPQIIDEAVAKRMPSIREQIEFELAQVQTEQESPEPVEPSFDRGGPPNVTPSVKVSDIYPAKPMTKSYAQRQREDLEARAAAKGVCPDCNCPPQYCACDAMAL